MQAQNNGASDMYDATDIIKELEGVISALVAEKEELKGQMGAIDAAIKRYGRAISALELPQALAPKAPKERSGQKREASKDSMRRSARWDDLQTAVIAYAREHDEFRQVDLRNDLEDLKLTSGHSSIAFDILRDDNILRVSRIDGNSKFYRLTQEALSNA
jgi:hypothetical protein